MALLRLNGHLKIAPGLNNLSDLQSIYSLDSGLKAYRSLGMVETTYLPYEDTFRRGNLRLAKIGNGKASWKFPVMTACALRTVLDYAEFDWGDLDAEVTIQTWNKIEFVNLSGILTFLPPDDWDSNPAFVENVLFSYSNLATAT